jgi:hypothetical protein
MFPVITADIAVRSQEMASLVTIDTFHGTDLPPRCRPAAMGASKSESLNRRNAWKA